VAAAGRRRSGGSGSGSGFGGLRFGGNLSVKMDPAAAALNPAEAVKMLASGSALKLKNLKAQVWCCRMQLFNMHCSLYIGLIT
jgi:hypothetical protein